TRQHQTRFYFFERGNDVALGVVPSHAGNETADALASCEEFHFLLHRESDKDWAWRFCVANCVCHPGVNAEIRALRQYKSGTYSEKRNRSSAAPCPLLNVSLLVSPHTRESRENISNCLTRW